jgi:hypothetical protein
MDIREMGWDGVDWIDVVLDMDKGRAVVKVLMKYSLLQKCGKFLD